MVYPYTAIRELSTIAAAAAAAMLCVIIAHHRTCDSSFHIFEFIQHFNLQRIIIMECNGEMSCFFEVNTLCEPTVSRSFTVNESSSSHHCEQLIYVDVETHVWNFVFWPLITQDKTIIIRTYIYIDNVRTYRVQFEHSSHHFRCLFSHNSLSVNVHLPHSRNTIVIVQWLHESFTNRRRTKLLFHLHSHAVPVVQVQ